jgi:hypothetical protein
VTERECKCLLFYQRKLKRIHLKRSSELLNGTKINWMEYRLGFFFPIPSSWTDKWKNKEATISLDIWIQSKWICDSTVNVLVVLRKQIWTAILFTSFHRFGVLGEKEQILTCWAESESQLHQNHSRISHLTHRLPLFMDTNNFTWNLYPGLLFGHGRGYRYHSLPVQVFWDQWERNNLTEYGVI